MYLYQKGDYESMRKDTLAFAKEKYFNGHSDTRSVQENFDLLTSFIQDSVDKHIPSKTSRSVFSITWITPEIRRKIRRKNKTRVAQSDLEKAEEFNGQFTDVFNKNEHTQVPPLDRSAPFKNDIAVSKDGVIKLLKGLNPSKALGPDELHPRVLKELATELGPVFAHLFQQLTLVKSQRNGLWQISAPFSRRVIGHLRAIIARFP